MPIMLVNFKDYLEASGRNAIAVAKLAYHISNKYGIEVGVVPSVQNLQYVAKMVWQYEMGGYCLPVFSQYIDSKFQAKNVKNLGIKGSVLNHADHRLSAEEVGLRTSELKSLGLSSVVCAADAQEARKLACFLPDYIAIEPPELIGTGRSVSIMKPDLIKRALNYVKSIDERIKVVCGGGISDWEGARSAVRIGTDGIFVSKAVVKADDIEAKMTELALGLLEK